MIVQGYFGWVPALHLGLSSYFLLRSEFSEAPVLVQFCFVVVWGTLSVLLLGPLVSFKQVELKGTSLLVSNYLRTIEVPLADVDAVVESWMPLNRAKVMLKRPCRFGSRIHFALPMNFRRPRLERLWKPHPAVAALREAAHAAPMIRRC
jgi:hypothetical protein